MSWSLFSDINSELLNEIKSKYKLSESDVLKLKADVNKSNDAVQTLIKGASSQAQSPSGTTKRVILRESQQKMLEAISRIVRKHSDMSVGVILPGPAGGNKPFLHHLFHNTLVRVPIDHRSLKTVPSMGTVVYYTLNLNTSSPGLRIEQKNHSRKTKVFSSQKRRIGWSSARKPDEPRAIIGETVDHINLGNNLNIVSTASRKHKASMRPKLLG
jgi:hypothetical protein